jgi:predicted transcriptional regulator
VPDVLAGELEKVAREAERPKSFLIQEAVEAYLPIMPTCRSHWIAYGTPLMVL